MARVHSLCVFFANRLEKLCQQYEAHSGSTGEDAWEPFGTVRLIKQRERFMKDIKMLSKNRGIEERGLLMGSIANYLLEFELYLAGLPKSK